MKRVLSGVLHSERRVSELVRFGLVGGVATAIQYVAYLGCLATGVLSAQVATVVSYCISLAFNFVLSNVFTFKTQPNKRKAAGFLVSHAVNMGLQIVLVSAFSPLVGEKLALLPAMVICVPVNYLMVRFALKGRGH